MAKKPRCVEHGEELTARDTVYLIVEFGELSEAMYLICADAFEEIGDNHIVSVEREGSLSAGYRVFPAKVRGKRVSRNGRALLRLNHYLLRESLPNTAAAFS